MRGIARNICCCIGLILISPVIDAAPLQVGAMKLGMSNAEVAKVANLRSCKPEGDRMVCLSTIEAQGENHDATLKFDRATKRLNWIELRLWGWASDDPRLPAMYRELNLRQCRDGMKETETSWFMKERCFETPDQVRSVTWDGGHAGRRGTRPRSILITVIRHKGVYNAFIAEKVNAQKQTKQAEENESFARGR